LVARFPAAAKHRSPAGGLGAWSPTAPLFVGAGGNRITRGTLQYRALRAFRRAGIDAERADGALVHGLRHTFATELDAEVSVYTLMRLTRARVNGDLSTICRGRRDRNQAGGRSESAL